ncbi:MAG: hypothetical protein ACRC0L_13050 [Angustibacter sp.]
MMEINDSSPLFGGAQRTQAYDEQNRPVLLGVRNSTNERTEARNSAGRHQPPPPLSTQILSRPAAAEWGWRGRMNRIAGRLIQLQPGHSEQEHRAAVQIVQQATFSRATNIGVFNPKGGVGKTPTALILAGVLGKLRGGSVIALEATESAGTLLQRAEGTPQRGLAELLSFSKEITTAGHLGAHTAPQTSNADVMGSIGQRPFLMPADVLEVRRIIDTYYRMSVTDTGNLCGGPSYSAALQTADAVVIPCPISMDALNGLEKVLSSIASASGHLKIAEGLSSRIVVVLTHDGGPEDVDVDTAVRSRLTELDVSAIVEIPFDPAIRRGGEISLSALSEDSLRAWTLAAAAATVALKSAPTEIDLVPRSTTNVIV